MAINAGVRLLDSATSRLWNLLRNNSILGIVFGNYYKPLLHPICFICRYANGNINELYSLQYLTSLHLLHISYQTFVYSKYISSNFLLYRSDISLAAFIIASP
jgi:hypothetical protein